MQLESAVDPGSLEIHDLLSESLGIPSFLSSKCDFLKDLRFIFNPGSSGAGHNLWRYEL
jgi:hypothetical protein